MICSVRDPSVRANERLAEATYLSNTLFPKFSVQIDNGQLSPRRSDPKLESSHFDVLFGGTDLLSISCGKLR